MPVIRSASNFHRTLTPLLRIRTPESPHFIRAYETLEQYKRYRISNNLGSPWMLPVRVLKATKRVVCVAASGFHRIPNLKAPLCPHIHLKPEQYTMKLHLNQIYGRNGERGNFYHAAKHNCRFIVLILDIEENAQQYITSPEEWNEFACTLHNFDDDEDDSDSAGSQVNTPLGSSSYSADTNEVEQYLLLGDPRLPRPTDAFFVDRIATARKVIDLALVNDTLEFHRNGIYRAQPELHPLAMKPVHSIMAPSLANLEHFDTHLGRTIREFNSVISLPQATWDSILSVDTHCTCCQCHFSIDRYNSHIVDGRCSMAAPMDQVYQKAVVQPQLAACTYPPDYQIPLAEDFMDTASGLAFSEWNSRIGIPLDVWILLSTGGVQCPCCHLVRSFDGHRSHLDLNSVCTDPGEISSSIATV
ncbi:hypothetical protein B0H14DRAFT_2825568 [Mycena olivaceomarginata]|nr:hypothetical protein B0H14DRAFT_2825568 [Mycena olivaceomarginata]